MIWRLITIATVEAAKLFLSGLVAVDCHWGADEMHTAHGMSRVQLVAVVRE